MTGADDEFPEAMTAAMWTILDKLNSTGAQQVACRSYWICQ